MALNPEKKWAPCDYIAQLPEYHKPTVSIPPWDDVPELPMRETELWPPDLSLPAWAERTLLAVILAFTIALVVYGIWLGPAVAR